VLHIADIKWQLQAQAKVHRCNQSKHFRAEKALTSDNSPDFVTDVKYPAAERVL